MDSSLKLIDLDEVIGHSNLIGAYSYDTRVVDIRTLQRAIRESAPLNEEMINLHDALDALYKSLQLFEPSQKPDDKTNPDDYQKYSSMVTTGLRLAINSVKQLPVKDAIAHAHWVQGVPITCSRCHKPAITAEDTDTKYSAYTTEFCPHCGAKMDEGKLPACNPSVVEVSKETKSSRRK